MKVRDEVRAAVRRQLQAMRQEDDLEWEVVRDRVLARATKANPDLIAERCWTLWHPVRGDVPLGFALPWALICEEYSSRLSGSIKKGAKAVSHGRVRSALGSRAEALSDEAMDVLGVQLVQLARVCAILGGEQDA